MSTDFLSTGCDILKQAVDADSRSAYAEALPLYIAGVERLQLALRY